MLKLHVYMLLQTLILYLYLLLQTSPVLAFTKPVPDGLLAWHVTLPYDSHLSWSVTSR